MKINVEIDSKGYLRLRTNIKNEFGNMQAKTRSLEIKLNRKSDFIKQTQKVSSKHPNYKEINSFIEEQKRLFESEFTKIKQQQTIIDKKEDFIMLYQEFINQYEKFSSQVSQICVMKIWQGFIKSKNLEILGCSQIDVELIKEFKKYLQLNRSEYTVNNYLAKTKSVINFIEINGKYEWLVHPFKNLKITQHSKAKEPLASEDFVKLLFLESFEQEYSELSEVFAETKTLKKNISKNFKTLLETRNMWCFAFFANGMRVTDLLLIKFNNFRIEADEIYLDYTTSKTHTHMIVNISLPILKFLETNIIKIVESSNREIFKIFISEYYRLRELEKTQDVRSLIHNELFKLLKLILTDQKLSNQLVFTRQQKYNQQFEKFDGIEILSERQRRTIISLTSTYNRSLKVVAREAYIHSTISSHIARHHFANFMASTGRSIYEIQQSLSHTKLTSTEKYIKSLTNNKDVSKKTTKSFFEHYFDNKEVNKDVFNN